jgi:hypothetical protein
MRRPRYARDVRTGLLSVLVVGLIGCDTERDTELAQLALADRLDAQAVEVRDNRSSERPSR